MLDKKVALFDRDEKGELLPLEVELIVVGEDEDSKTLEGEKIKIIPLTRGELRRIVNISSKPDEEQDSDAQLIMDKCVEPKFDAKEIKHIKGHISKAIVDTILFHSGVKIVGSKKKSVIQAEDEFAKN